MPYPGTHRTVLEVLREKTERYREFACVLEKLADFAKGLTERERKIMWDILDGKTP